MSTPSELPDLAEVFARVLRRVAPERQPLLIALAERLAAERYRGWAGQVVRADRKAALLACADREDEIARRVEALFPSAAELQRELLAGNPDFLEINRSLFAPYPLAQQFVLQARGERLGAATWRMFAQQEKDVATRDVLLGCALLEEENAAVLESISAAGGSES